MMAHARRVFAKFTQTPHKPKIGVSWAGRYLHIIPVDLPGFAQGLMTLSLCSRLRELFLLPGALQSYKRTHDLFAESKPCAAVFLCSCLRLCFLAYTSPPSPGDPPPHGWTSTKTRQNALKSATATNSCKPRRRTALSSR